MRIYLIALLALVPQIGYGAKSATDPIPGLARSALSSDSRISRAAKDKLRDIGPTALQKLLLMRDVMVRDAISSKKHLHRIDDVIDHVCAQRYGSVSGLFWYTDLEKAKKISKRTGKPILSLRMMGNLTDEFSCANSRFFRTLLYANANVSKYMRDNFVLHWKSVRPVPKITVDFGDGRKLCRTLTGNSAHYVLDSDGLVVDALPGLYSAQEFLNGLTRAHDVAEAMIRLPERMARLPNNRSSVPSPVDITFRNYHSQRLQAIRTAWQNDLAALGIQHGAVLTERRNAAAPAAEQAAVLAVSKVAVEAPLVSNVTMRFENLEKKTDDDTWKRIAELHIDKVLLDQQSKYLIARLTPTAIQASQVSYTKRREESPLLRMFTHLRGTVAADTVRNEYDLHRRIHEWLAKPNAERDVEKLNERVYAELFLTPSSDPWIGLVSADVFTGLENGGIRGDVSTAIR